MKPEGIRKAFAEQGAEGAIYYLAEVLEKTIADFEAEKAMADKPQASFPKEEEQ